MLAKRLFRQNPRHPLTKSYTSTMKKEQLPYPLKIRKARLLPDLMKGSVLMIGSSVTILLARATTCPKIS